MTGKLADIRIQYKYPNDTVSHVQTVTSKFDFIPFAEVEKCYQFSAAVIMFGSLLKESPYMKNIAWNQILDLANQSLSPDDLLQKEFITIVQQAKTLYNKMKKNALL
jgi:Ca-activated chloride channel family protein